jgi:hypothetical protein
MNRIRAVIIAGVIASFASSCASDPSDVGGLSPRSAASSTGAASVQTTVVTSGPTPQETGSNSAVSNEQVDAGLIPYVDIAVADLAKRLAVDPAEITVVSAALEVWKDSALGCPQPGQQYAQVATDGSRIRLSVGGKAYAYHAGGSRAPFLCEHPA